MRNPATVGGALHCQLGGDTAEITAPRFNVQALLDRALRHHWRAEWLGSILAMRLDRPQRIVLAAGALHALDPDLREDVAEAVLDDLRAGPPVVPLLDVRAEAREWAAWASRGELRAYMGAIWNRLAEADRADFLRTVKRRAA